MLTFLLDNIGTIVVLLIVVAVVAAIIISHFRAKKKGKSSCGSCGCGCASCAMAGKCHSNNHKSVLLTKATEHFKCSVACFVC